MKDLVTAAPPKIQAKDRLIVALDLDSAHAARELVDQLQDHAGAFKVGLQLFTATGPAFVRELCSSGHRIFLDLKFHDIPNTVAKSCVEAARIGVWMLNLHALGGNEMMSRAVYETEQYCDKSSIKQPKIIGVTVLTSSAGDALHEVGIEDSVENEVLRLARLARVSGLDGVVASSREAPVIREEFGDDFLIVTPGIRPENASNDDQKRVMSPAGAIRSGADYLVIGRPITGSIDVRTAAKNIINEIANTAHE